MTRRPSVGTPRPGHVIEVKFSKGWGEWFYDCAPCRSRGSYCATREHAQYEADAHARELPLDEREVL